MRLLLASALLLSGAGRLAAQASAYVPLDDPRLPMFEHLVALGDVRDPSPMVRPFRRADAIRMLNAALAHGRARDTLLVQKLREAWLEDTAQAHWQVEGRAGLQAYTHARRDPLHPGGPGGARPYVELGLGATFGNIVLASRPAIEPRLVKDPDWSGRKDLEVAGRQVEAYASAQFKYFRILYGELDQNWGPVGVSGIGLSNYGYPHPQLGVQVGTDRFRLTAQASTLADQTDTAGRTVHRYFFAHRLDARLSSRLQLGLWETLVIGGPERSFDGRYRNPVSLLLLANEYGLGDRGNILLGLDLSWRVTERVTLQGQFGLDDFQYQHRSGPNSYPDRYAFTLLATGPLGCMAWRALYTQASSLAFRTLNPVENLTDQGVGLGRSTDDNDQLTLMLSTPIRHRLMLSPELTLLRQGEGRISDPVPARGPASASTPALFIGTVERTWRAALGISGREGPLAIQGEAGLHYRQNADHVSGRNRTAFIGRVQVTLGLGRRGTF